jgi:hypothetical protein
MRYAPCAMRAFEQGQLFYGGHKVSLPNMSYLLSAYGFVQCQGQTPKLWMSFGRTYFLQVSASVIIFNFDHPRNTFSLCHVTNSDPGRNFFSGGR